MALVLPGRLALLVGPGAAVVRRGVGQGGAVQGGAVRPIRLAAAPRYGPIPPDAAARPGVVVR